MTYPPEAYAEPDVPWWEARQYPGSHRAVGGSARLSAWLTFNKEVGEVFTMRELRAAVGDDGVANDQEHLNRRLRELRKMGWVIPSHQERGDLHPGEYLLEVKGWSVSQETPRPPRTGAVSQRVRAVVFERDGFRCVMCGVGRGEPYPDPPPGTAVLTIGHRVAQALGGGDETGNLQTECQRCNQPRRAEGRNPETLSEVYESVRTLPRADKEKLLDWLLAGKRNRSKLDEVYDRAKMLGDAERSELEERLRRSI